MHIRQNFTLLTIVMLVISSCKLPSQNVEFVNFPKASNVPTNVIFEVLYEEQTEPYKSEIKRKDLFKLNKVCPNQEQTQTDPNQETDKDPDEEKKDQPKEKQDQVHNVSGLIYRIGPYTKETEEGSKVYRTHFFYAPETLDTFDAIESCQYELTFGPIKTKKGYVQKTLTFTTDKDGLDDQLDSQTDSNLKVMFSPEKLNGTTQDGSYTLPALDSAVVISFDRPISPKLVKKSVRLCKSVFKSNENEVQSQVSQNELCGNKMQLSGSDSQVAVYLVEDLKPSKDGFITQKNRIYAIRPMVTDKDRFDIKFQFEIDEEEKITIDPHLQIEFSSKLPNPNPSQALTLTSQSYMENFGPYAHAIAIR